jgi:hypothetical protein
MTPKTKYLAALIVVLAGVAAAAAPADVAGEWTMSYTTRDGVKMTSTLTLKAEGETLTGTISSPRGSVPLNEASVKGDDVAFAIERVGFGDRIRIDYTGKVKGDTMTLKMKAGAREPIDVTARRGAAGPK